MRKMVVAACLVLMRDLEPLRIGYGRSTFAPFARTVPISHSIFSQCLRSFRPGAFLLGVSGASATAAYRPRPAIEIPCSASLARRLYDQVCRMGL